MSCNGSPDAGLQPAYLLPLILMPRANLCILFAFCSHPSLLLRQLHNYILNVLFNNLRVGRHVSFYGKSFTVILYSPFHSE